MNRNTLNIIELTYRKDGENTSLKPNKTKMSYGTYTSQLKHWH